MIQTHVFNAWVRPDAKVGWAWSYFKVSGGAPAPMFCFLAGVSLALALRSAGRAGLTPTAALVKALRRALWLLGVAVALRLWFFVAGGARHPIVIAQFDVLNCMAVSLAMAAALGAWRARVRWNVAPLAGGIALSFAAPFIAAAWPQAWRETIPFAYVLGNRPISRFPLVPWAAFTLVGVGAGTLWSSGQDALRARRIMLASAAGGLALAGLGLLLWRPSRAFVAATELWATGPAFFIVRLGLLVALCAVAALLVRPSPRWSWMRQLGTTSLFVYCVHLELVYGKLGRPLRDRLTLPQTFAVFALLTALMLAASIAKNRISERWRAQRDLHATGSRPHAHPGGKP